MLRTAHLLDKLKERDKVVYMDDEPAGCKKYKQEGRVYVETDRTMIYGLYHTGRYTARNRLHDTTSDTGEIHSSIIWYNHSINKLFQRLILDRLTFRKE